MTSPPLSNDNMDVGGSYPNLSLENALLQDEANGVTTTPEDLLKQQQLKIDMLIEENLHQKAVLKQKEEEFLVVKNQMAEQAQNLQRLINYHEQLQKTSSSNSTAMNENASDSPVIVEDKRAKQPPVPASFTNILSNKDRCPSFSFASFVPPSHTSTSGFQESYSSASNPFTQLQEIVDFNQQNTNRNFVQQNSSSFSHGVDKPHNPFYEPLLAAPATSGTHLNIQNNSSSQPSKHSKNPFLAEMSTFNPQMDNKQTKNPFSSIEKKSPVNHVSNPLMPSNRSNQALHTNRDKKFMMPYRDWLKKHGMKENQMFRGKRGGNPQKKSTFQKNIAGMISQMQH